MLKHLVVRGLAVVDNAELELDGGMTVLTGETGAGKSLIVDALQLALGGRASADLVRAGTPNAEVVAVFEPEPPVLQWMAQQALDDEDDSCVLRRVVGGDGRSRAFINARPVPVSQLRSLGEQLVDVHGQHTHQALLQGAAQRDLLDSFLDSAAALEEVASLHGAIEALGREIESLDLGTEDPLARLDYLDFQIQELREAPIAPQTLAAINKEHRRLAHAAEILEGLARANAALGAEQDGAAAGVGSALRALEAAARMDSRLDETVDILRECATLLAEAQGGMRRHVDGLELNDARLGELEQTLARLHELSRKHRCPPEALHERLTALETESARIETAGTRLEAIKTQQADALRCYREAARTLHGERRRAAEGLCTAANEVLQTLGMKGARIDFEITHDAAATPSRHGTDQVALRATTNPGQPALPLARIASGGELSRIALAIHAVAVDARGAATVVFDEVDVGVGGAVAEIVGRRMRDLGRRCQVLAVTHQPQVAAQAHRHLAVRKEQTESASRSRVVVLEGEAREQEIARMLGGMDVTRRTVEHAREMLASGRDTRERARKRRCPAA